VQRRGQCKGVDSAKAWTVQRRGQCEGVDSVKAWTVQRRGQCKGVDSVKAWTVQKGVAQILYPLCCGTLQAYLGWHRKFCVHYAAGLLRSPCCGTLQVYLCGIASKKQTKEVA